jgi:membrane protein YdbS with pleckstrin-like domain
MSEDSKVLVKAEFHQILVSYFFLYVLGFLFVIIVSIPLIPFWLIIGLYYCRRYFTSLECVLKEQTLELKKGHFFHVEKTIPLDKIQDLTLRQGPLLRMFKLHMLDIETAGQSSPQGNSDAKIIGIINAREFRDQVLTQRDLVVAKDENVVAKSSDNEKNVTAILLDIKDVLKQIEKKIEK